ncbi:hypothetical protein LJC59_03380 [Desulfovibrio sp. OttesenSCG-928-A18]|nr:hypothetical protein [Desulfovibrio sp. OttesenSCG-928-A18]
MKISAASFLALLCVCVLFGSRPGTAAERMVFSSDTKVVHEDDRKYTLMVVKSDTHNTDTIILGKVLSASFNKASLSENAYYRDAIGAMFRFLRRYKIGKLDRPKIGYTLMKEGTGFMDDYLYVLNSWDLRRVQERDFQIADYIENTNVVPIRDVLGQFTVVRIADNTVDEEKTKALRAAVKEFDFGPGEDHIEKARSKKEKEVVISLQRFRTGDNPKSNYFGYVCNGISFGVQDMGGGTMRIIGLIVGDTYYKQPDVESAANAACRKFITDK